MARTTIFLERTIDASHVIPDHPGKCARLHGHTYRFEVWVSGELAPGATMLVDFFDIKREIDAWDHRHLNDEVDYVPTAELLAADMQRRLRAIAAAQADPAAPDGVTCTVRLWETPSCSARVSDALPTDGHG